MAGMNNLVERLRDFASDSMGMEPGDRQVLAEAADEIEKLRALIVGLAGCIEELEALAEEVRCVREVWFHEPDQAKWGPTKNLQTGMSPAEILRRYYRRCLRS